MNATPYPIGLIPKEIHNDIVNKKRFADVCRAITNYYNAGLEINIEWINEYNELIKTIQTNKKN
jgi:hypothetical protein